jgi:hypothetical protein
MVTFVKWHFLLIKQELRMIYVLHKEKENFRNNRMVSHINEWNSILIGAIPLCI